MHNAFFSSLFFKRIVFIIIIVCVCVGGGVFIAKLMVCIAKLQLDYNTVV